MPGYALALIMGVDFLKPFAFSLTLAVIAAVWVLKYGAARQGRRYSQGRQAIGRDDRFRVLGKVIFVSMNAVTLASFWTDSKVLLLFHQNDMLRIAGMVVLFVATLLYIVSMNHLGGNYSPCFDHHRPLQIVTQGPYRYVRHPLYLANILQGVGYALAGSSLWVLALCGYGIFTVVRAVSREESYLSKTFIGYESYQAKTARLIPFVY
jgi:protein-S-isoprenylcysteine O-methyltransferase Ste14